MPFGGKKKKLPEENDEEENNNNNNNVDHEEEADNEEEEQEEVKNTGRRGRRGFKKSNNTSRRIDQCHRYPAPTGDTDDEEDEEEENDDEIASPSNSATSNLKHIVKLTIGDWSSSGHRKSENVMLMTNLSSNEVDRAFIKATKKIGFNFTSDVACNFEEGFITMKQLRQMRNAGVAFEFNGEEERIEEGGQSSSWGQQGKKKDDDGKDEDKKHIQFDGYEEYVQLYLAVIKLGNPKFDFKIVEGNEIMIGGYGLFVPY